MPSSQPCSNTRFAEFPAVIVGVGEFAINGKTACASSLQALLEFRLLGVSQRDVRCARSAILQCRAS